MRISALSLTLATVAACQSPDTFRQDDANFRARVSVSLETDVASISVTATPVDCATGLATGEAPTTDTANLLGRALADFENDLDPTDAASDHDFADVFMVLAPGCYDVDATPLQADGVTASTDCSNAADLGVQVTDGVTTEVLLMSSCLGMESGGLTTIVAFNETPTISDGAFSASAFTDQCVATTLCAEVTDPNADPIEFVWTAATGAADFTVVSSTQTDTVSEECVDVLPTTGDDVDVDVTVFDLLEDGTRIEDYLAANGVSATSHDSLIVPVYVAPDPTAAPDCGSITLATCPCFDLADLDAFFLEGANREATGSDYVFINNSTFYPGDPSFGIEDATGYATQLTFQLTSGNTTTYHAQASASFTDYVTGPDYGSCVASTNGLPEPFSLWFPTLTVTPGYSQATSMQITYAEYLGCEQLLIDADAAR